MSMDRMISKMSKMYPMLIALGFMIVGISLVIGFVNSQNAAEYYAIDKATRDGINGDAGQDTRDLKATTASVGIWLPYFKFLGVGLILGGIVMALRQIIDSLRDVGENVLTNLDESKRPALPTPPWYAMLMPMLMMIGELIFIFTLVISLGVAADARDLLSGNDIKTIDTTPGLTSTLQGIKSTASWLVPLKFFAVATEFLAITIGLATIIYILGAQTKILDKALKIAEGGS